MDPGPLGFAQSPTGQQRPESRRSPAPARTGGPGSGRRNRETHLDTYSLERVSVATASLDSTTSRSNLQSVWHWVSDSFRCFRAERRPHQDGAAAGGGAAEDRTRSYPDVRGGGGGVKELADDVGGGGDAEEDGADDLLPPGQQQHRILPAAARRARFAPLDQADRRLVALLPVEAAVGEAVAVVCAGGGGSRSRG